MTKPARPSPVARTALRHSAGCSCPPCDKRALDRAIARASAYSLAGFSAALVLIAIDGLVRGTGGVLLMLGLR